MKRVALDTLAFLVITAVTCAAMHIPGSTDRRVEQNREDGPAIEGIGPTEVEDLPTVRAAPDEVWVRVKSDTGTFDDVYGSGRHYRR